VENNSPLVPRTSLRWHVPAPLTSEIRNELAERLEAGFSDENKPRSSWGGLAPDAHVLVVPGEGDFVVVAHFADPPEGLPATKPEWVAQRVAAAVLSATGMSPSAAEAVTD
jgi:hypothetical protein